MPLSRQTGQRGFELRSQKVALVIESWLDGGMGSQSGANITPASYEVVPCLLLLTHQAVQGTTVFLEARFSQAHQKTAEFSSSMEWPRLRGSVWALAWTATL